jgi:hypothetical protein
MKRIALGINAVTLGVACAFAFYQFWHGIAVDLSTLGVVIGIAVIHALYFITAVTPSAVKRAALEYADELFAPW